MIKKIIFLYKCDCCGKEVESEVNSDNIYFNEKFGNKDYELYRWLKVKPLTISEYKVNTEREHYMILCDECGPRTFPSLYGQEK
jgi:hypothetical protein